MDLGKTRRETLSTRKHHPNLKAKSCDKPEDIL